MRIVLVDNYDSFTYNLVHALEQYCANIDVVRNDEIVIDKIEEYTHIVISPGPGLPKDAGKLMQLIERYANTKKILGVCLGMQAIVEYYGGKLYNQSIVKHGLSMQIDVNDELLYKSLPKKIEVGLYHSWAVQKKYLPEVFKITAESKEEVIMSVKHKGLPIYGVQYHPESIMTNHGSQIIKNWLELA